MPLQRLLSTFFMSFLLSTGYLLRAQETSMPVVSGAFKNMSVEQFLLQLEKQTGFHFYFDTSQLDSITVDVSVNKKPLPELLKLALSNTGLSFAYDEQNNV